jgi:hypothetical protein
VLATLFMTNGEVQTSNVAVYTQSVLDATQKQPEVDQQQHSCETLIYQSH